MNIHACDRVLVFNPDLKVAAHVLLSHRVIDQRHWLCNLNANEYKTDTDYFQFTSGLPIGGGYLYQERTGLVVAENISRIDWESIFYRNCTLDEICYLRDILYREIPGNYSPKVARLLEKVWGLNMANFLLLGDQTLIDFIAAEPNIYRRVKKFVEWSNVLDKQAGSVLAIVL